MSADKDIATLFDWPSRIKVPTVLLTSEKLSTSDRRLFAYASIYLNVDIIFTLCQVLSSLENPLEFMSGFILFQIPSSSFAKLHFYGASVHFSLANFSPTLEF